MFVHLVPAQLLQSPTGQSPQAGWEVVSRNLSAVGPPGGRRPGGFSMELSHMDGQVWGRHDVFLQLSLEQHLSPVCSPPLLGDVEGPVAAVGLCGLGGRTLGSPQTGVEGSPGEAAAEYMLL